MLQQTSQENSQNGVFELQYLDQKSHLNKDWFANYHFHLVDSFSKLQKLVDKCISVKTFSLDVETTGLDLRVYPDAHFRDGKVTKHGIRTMDQIAGLCISFDGINGYYIPVGHRPIGYESDNDINLPWDETFEEITKLVNSGSKIIFHNAKFDQEVLYPVTGKEVWGKDEFEDTFLMSKIISPLKSSPSGLKPLTKANFNVEMIELSELFTPEMMKLLKREKQGMNFSYLHPKEGLEYGCSDGIFTYKLYPILKARLQQHDIPPYLLEKSFTQVLRKLERNRVHLDMDRVRELLNECIHEMDVVGDIVRNIIETRTGNTGKWMTLNIGSPKQLSQALVTDQEGLRIKPTMEMLGESEDVLGNDEDEDVSGESSEIQFSLKDEAVKSLHNAYGNKYSIRRDGKEKPESLFELILEWRHYQKMRGSYMEPLSLAADEYGDVRPNFNQLGTDTTRLSSRAGKIADGYSGINFQGIPRDSDEDKPELFKQIRTCIIPRKPYVLLKLDYAGEELRVITNMSGDRIWIKSFNEGDGDVHSITSRALFNKPDISKDERNRGKRSNFAIIYGGGAGAISGNVGCSIDEAQRKMDNLRKAVPELMAYIEHQKKFARKHKCVYTAFGRKIPIPTIDSPIRKIRAKAERCAINYTIQATSAEVLKLAMCFVDKNIRNLGWEDRVRYVLTVHDEVVFEVLPQYVMEITPKLDEWMTLPWKLPKSHGRPWVVPLLTEPGVDIHWRARFDYFKMVDGLPVEKKDIVDGEYVGKLKKDEFYEAGFIYQKIPDFLVGVIERKPKSLKQEVESEVDSSESTVSPEEPVIELHAPEAPNDVEKAEEIQEKAEETISRESEVQKSPHVSTNKYIDVSVPSNNLSISNKNDDILRWVLKCPMNHLNAKKLRALCILTEGSNPLRVISHDGSILVGEDSGINVDKDEFLLYARLFGLG